MDNVLGVAIPLIAFALGGIVTMGAFLLGRFNTLGRKRKSPFTSDFLRGPGHTLGEQIEELRSDVIWDVTFGPVLPLLVLALTVTRAYLGQRPISETEVQLGVLTCVLVLAYLGMRLYRKGRRLRQLNLGYEGEIAVGQELNQLLADGFRVFHDFPAAKYNIDHIVIGPTGVFAVETKARAKPDTGDGKADARVELHGRALRFPTWTETEPLEQAKRQAEGLSRWLSKAVGETVAVWAVVALPGWFVVTEKPGDVLVYNGRNYRSLFPKARPDSPLDQVMIQRIAHQVEQRCRNIEPKAVRRFSEAAPSGK